MASFGYSWIFSLSLTRMILCYISNCCCGVTSESLSWLLLLLFVFETSPIEAVPAGTVCSGTASVFRRAMSAPKVSIIDASSIVREHNSICTVFDGSFEYPKVYLRHPRSNLPLIATFTLMRGSESAKTRASWNARRNSLCSFSLLACHDLQHISALALVLEAGSHMSKFAEPPPTKDSKAHRLAIRESESL